jgi:hypothetical protein
LVPCQRLPGSGFGPPGPPPDFSILACPMGLLRCDSSKQTTPGDVIFYFIFSHIRNDLAKMVELFLLQIVPTFPNLGVTIPAGHNI